MIGKERNKQYKQTILDFVNAETTDNACLNLIRNLTKLQSFSSHFEEKAQEAFPLLGTYTCLPEQEKMLFDLLLEEKRLFDKVGGTLAYIMATLMDYDAIKRTLTYIKTPQTGAMNKIEDENADVREELISDLEKRLMKEFISLSDFYPEYKDWTFGEAHELVKTGKEIINLKKTVSEFRFSEIKKMFENYSKILAGHKKIEQHKSYLKEILKETEDGKIPPESNTLNALVQQYNTFCKIDVKISSDGYLYNALKFPEEDHFIHINIHGKPENSPWFQPYTSAAVFCLVEFLRSL